MTREERRQFVLAYEVLVRRYAPTEKEAIEIARASYAPDASSLASKVLDACEGFVSIGRKAR